MEETQAICSLCEEPIELEVGEYPSQRDGEDYCDDCYHEECEFTCDWCREYGDVDDQHRYLVVFDAEEAGLPLAGVYLVQKTPYYCSPLIGRGQCFPHALQWLGAVPAAVQWDEWYPCGHFCAVCQKRMLKDITEHQRIIHDVR